MNEWLGLHHSQPKVVLSQFSQIMAAKTLKNLLTDSEIQNFPEGEGNQNKKRKTKSFSEVTHSVALVMNFLVAENKNQQLEGLPLAAFAFVPEIISYGKIH